MRPVLRAAIGLALLLGVSGLIRAGGDQNEVRQVLDKAIKSLGGEAKVAKLKGAGWKGTTTLDVGGQQITLNHEGSALGWDKQRLDLEIQEGGRTQTLLLVINGDKAWVNARGKVEEPKAKEIAPVRDFFFGLRAVHMLPALKGKDFTLSHLGELKVGDRASVGLSVSRKGSPNVSLFFDKKTGRPLKAAFRIMVAGNQEKELELFYGNYKAFDGLQHFTKMTVKVDGMEFVTELSEIRASGELEASLFDRP